MDPMQGRGSFRAPERIVGRWSWLFTKCFGSGAILCSWTAFALVCQWIKLSNNGLGSRKSDNYFNWHIFLMSLSFLVFMVPSVLSFEVLPFSRSMNKYFHFLLNTLALGFAIAGFYIVYDYMNNLTGQEHGNFQSGHECFGLITLTLMCINYFGGLFMYIFKMGGRMRGILKPFHKRLGLFVTLLGLATLCLGIQWAWTYDKHQWMERTIIVLTVMSIGGIIFAVSKFVDKKEKDDHDMEGGYGEIYDERSGLNPINTDMYDQ